MILVPLSAIGLLVIAMALLSMLLMIRRRARRLLESRLHLMATGIKVQGGTPSTGPGASQRAAEQVRRIISLGLSHTWGTKTKATTMLAFAALAALIVWWMAAFVLTLPKLLADLAAIAAFVLLPRLLIAREQSKAERKFTDTFPDAIDMGVRMLRAGLPISAAVRAIGEEAPSPVDMVFKGLADQVEIGIPFEEALAATSVRIGLSDFRFFSVAVTLQRATGGNLASTLEILSDIMRKRRAVRLKASATTAEVRVSAYILSSMPFLVTGVLLLAQPGYLQPLITDYRGKIILAAAVVMMVMGFLMMRQMMRSAVRV